MSSLVFFFKCNFRRPSNTLKVLAKFNRGWSSAMVTMTIMRTVIGSIHFVVNYSYLLYDTYITYCVIYYTLHYIAHCTVFS